MTATDAPAAAGPVFFRAPVVADVMTYLAREPGPDAGDDLSPALGIPPGTPLPLVVALMAWEGVQRLPVLGADGRVIGVVTALDVWPFRTPETWR